MKNGKCQATPEKREQKSRGAVWAEQTRKRCNPLTNVQREKLLNRAMQIAYGTEAEPAAARRR
jgi:hypothetical protein